MSKEKPASPETTRAPERNVTKLPDGDLDKVTGGDGKVQVHDISVTKRTDVATTKLL